MEVHLNSGVYYCQQLPDLGDSEHSKCTNLGRQRYNAEANVMGSAMRKPGQELEILRERPSGAGHSSRDGVRLASTSLILCICLG